MQVFLGSIQAFAFNFTPVGWLQCSGQTLAISQYTALFSLLGTQFGGNGSQTFNLPDLRGRAIIHQGQGPGLPMYTIGQSAGSTQVTLLQSQMPQHNHSLNVVGGGPSQTSPQGALLCEQGALSATRPPVFTPVNTFAASTATPILQMATAALGMAGGNVPVPIESPYLVMNYCIATEGIFPSRS